MSKKQTTSKKIAALLLVLVLFGSSLVGVSAVLKPKSNASSSSLINEVMINGMYARFEGMSINANYHYSDEPTSTVKITFPELSEQWEFVRTPVGAGRWLYQVIINGVVEHSHNDVLLHFQISEFREGSTVYIRVTSWQVFNWTFAVGSVVEVPTFVILNYNFYDIVPMVSHRAFFYNVRFEYLNETATAWVSDTNSVREYTKANVPTIPVIESQTFSHWATVSGSSLNQVITQDSVLRAVYIPVHNEELYQARFLLLDDTVFDSAIVSSLSPSLISNQIPSYTSFVPPLYRFVGWRTKTGAWAQSATITDNTDFYPVLAHDFELENILSVNTERIVYERGKYDRAELAQRFSNGVFTLPDDLSNQARGDAFLATEFSILNRTIPWSFRGDGETYFSLALNTRENDFIPTLNQYNVSQKQLVLEVQRNIALGASRVRLMYGSEELKYWVASEFLRQPEDSHDWEHNAVDFKLSVEGSRIRWELWYGAGRTNYETGLLPNSAYQYNPNSTVYFLGLVNVQFLDWSGVFVHKWNTYEVWDILKKQPKEQSNELPLELPTIKVSGRHALNESFNARLFKVSFKYTNGDLISEVEVLGNTQVALNQIPIPRDIEGQIFFRWFNTGGLELTSDIRQDTTFWAQYVADPDIKPPENPKGNPNDKPIDDPPITKKDNAELYQIIIVLIGIMVVIGLAVTSIKIIFKGK